MLFRRRLAIVHFEDDKNSDKNYRYGTYCFGDVREKMNDKKFGIKDKVNYFQKTTWYVNGDRCGSASLESDTIMLYGSNVYILDVKYINME